MGEPTDRIVKIENDIKALSDRVTALEDKPPLSPIGIFESIVGLLIEKVRPKVMDDVKALDVRLVKLEDQIKKD